MDICRSKQQFCVYLADDLGMNLGKMIAQAAHASGASGMARMRLQSENNDSVCLTLTQPARQVHQSHPLLIPDIHYCHARQLPGEDDEVIEIIDAGKTVFDGPTKTCVGYAPLLGNAVPPPLRLGFDDDTLDFKQAFFVNRKVCQNSEIDDNTLIALMAAASTVCILENVVDGSLTLDKHSALYQWITSAFGKTVVGTKKQSKFEQVLQLLDIDKIRYQPVFFNQELIGVCSEPIAADQIHNYTKYKTFHLL